MLTGIYHVLAYIGVFVFLCIRSVEDVVGIGIPYNEHRARSRGQQIDYACTSAHPNVLSLFTVPVMEMVTPCRV
jgi:hypothetical protein